MARMKTGYQAKHLCLAEAVLDRLPVSGQSQATAFGRFG